MYVLLVALGCALPVGNKPDTDGGTEDTGPAPVSHDKDGDGYTDDADCDDNRASVHPNATEICNDLDDDCDGEVDEDKDLLLYLDADGDGFGDQGSNGTAGCTATDGFALNDADCDDSSADVYPAAPEICDGLDNDCNGDVDEDPTTYVTFYADEDGDGAGDPASELQGCTMPADAADNAWDCDDTNASEPVFADALATGTGSGTFASPFKHLQDAIDASTECVVVFPGTYGETIDFHGHDVHVRSTEGSSRTTIRGIDRDSVVLFQNRESSAAVLEGFTITGGTGHVASSSSTSYDSTRGITYYYYDYFYYGGGVYIADAYPTLIDVVVKSNALPTYEYTTDDRGSYVVYDSKYSYGGGIYVVDGGASLTDVTIEENTGYYGAALYAYDSLLTGSRVRIVGNYGDYLTVEQDYGSATFDAFVMNGNTSTTSYSGWYTDYAELELSNAAVLAMDAAVWNYGSDVRIDSSIVAGNDVGVEDLTGGESGSWRLSYSDVTGNGIDFSNVTDPTGTYGNVSEEPGFVSFTADDDYDSDDLHLTDGSALRDAGNPGSSRTDADGSRNDIGPYGGPAGEW